MHELSVTESLLEIALRHAATAEAERITALHLEIGQLSTIVDDSIQFYWDIIAKDTIAQGATLFFHRIPSEFRCLDCNKRYHPTGDQLTCPECDGAHVKIVSGDQFRLEAIEVDS